MLDGSNGGSGAATGRAQQIESAAADQAKKPAKDTTEDVSNTLLAALTAFIEKTNGKSEPAGEDQVTVRHYVGLSFFFLNVVLAYLTIDSLLPALVESTFLRLTIQIVPLVVGSSFLAARASELQKRLLANAPTKAFLASMPAFLIVIGAAAFTQLPKFAIPVIKERGDSSLMFCAQENYPAGKVANINPEAPAPAEQSCAGGTFQTGNGSIESLKLFHDYMITATAKAQGETQGRTEGNQIERYYLGSEAVFKAALRKLFNLSPNVWHVGTVTPDIEVMKWPKDRKIEITIVERNPGPVVYVPLDSQCSLHQNDVHTMQCHLEASPETSAPYTLVLPGGVYSFQAAGCKVSAAGLEAASGRITSKTKIKLDCA